MCSSSIPASRLRATSPISRARITAPSGSCRKAPSGRAGSSAASVPAVSSCAASWRIDQRGAAHPLARERARPQHELDGRAVGAHPLRLDIVGNRLAIERRPELHAGRHPRREREHPVERRRPVLGARARGLAVPGRAARRIEPHGIHGKGVGCRPRGVHETFGRAVGHRHAVAERARGCRRRSRPSPRRRRRRRPRARARRAPARRRRSRSRGPRRGSCRRRGSARRGARRSRGESPAPSRRG